MINNFSVFDIEAKNWNEFLMLGYFDGANYHEFYSIQNFLECLVFSPNTPTSCYAHFGGIYDFNFIFDFLFSESPIDNEITDIVMQGKKVLCFKAHLNCREQKKTIHFIDSSGLFPFSLKYLTESFDVLHKKTEIDFNEISINDEMKKYLKNDCLGLYECLETYLQDEYISQIGLKLTRSSASFQVFKQFFCHDQKLPMITPSIAAYARKSYLGGRTEIFKPIFKGDKNNTLKIYDINSLYPSVMRDNIFPAEFKSYTNEFFSDELGIYDLTVTCPDIDFPLLGIKSKIKKGGAEKYIFPTGTFRGHFCSPEINKALELGYKIEQVHSGILFESAGYFFKKFVDHFYDLRKNTNDPVKKIMYKDLLNHLYGRLAINQVREEISLTPKEGAKLHSTIKYPNHEIRFYASTKNIFTYSNPALSSFVTSYSRLKLYDAFKTCDFDVYNCDTDSIFTPKLLPTSGQLGDLKLEKELTEACFLVLKGYSVKDLEGKIHSKLKGFPNNLIQNLDIDSFYDAFAGDLRIKVEIPERGLVGFKTGIKKGNLLQRNKAMIKKQVSQYDKRIIFLKNKEYISKPIKLEYQRELF
jgi:hypothetical protein